MAIRKIEPKVSKDMIDCCAKSTPEPRYPKFRIELDFLPEAKKWEIGKEYTIGLKVKMTGISISKYQNDSEYDIVGIDPELKEK